MFFRHNLLGFLWILFIFFLSSIRGSEFPDLSFWKILTFDKVAHAFVFGVLVILLIVGFKKQYTFSFLRYRAKWSAFLLSLSYGILIEVFQMTIFEERSGDLLDGMANAFGCLLGIGAFRLLYGKELF